MFKCRCKLLDNANDFDKLLKSAPWDFDKLNYEYKQYVEVAVDCKAHQYLHELFSLLVYEEESLVTKNADNYIVESIYFKRFINNKSFFLEELKAAIDRLSKNTEPCIFDILNEL